MLQNMTRENKLALVIGFGLILFVGVLVSDHFSAAANQQAADLRGPQAPLVAMAPVQPRIIDLFPLEPQRPSPVTQQLAPEPVSSDIVPVTEAAIVDPPGFVPVDGPAERPVTDFRLPDLQAKLDQYGQVEVALHDVTKGQTMYAICRERYGDPSLVKALAAFNGMGDATALQVGRRIRIPSAAVLRGEVPVASHAPAASVKADTALPTSKPATAKADHQTYTVRAGDTFSGIALRLMGSRSRMQELIDLNDGVVDDPDNLTIGTQIRVPRAAARNRAAR
jgi:nucleoid-associated protein YgaU